MAIFLFTVFKLIIVLRIQGLKGTDNKMSTLKLNTTQEPHFGGGGLIVLNMNSLKGFKKSE